MTPQLPLDYVTPADRIGAPMSPTLDDKRRAAIAWMGERWLLHPTNAPRKGRYFFAQPKRGRA